MARRTKLLIATAAVLIVGAVGFALFRPDTLFIDSVSDEQLDTDVAAALEASRARDADPTGASDDADGDGSGMDDSMADGGSDGPAEPDASAVRVLAQGEWVSLDHPTEGSVAIVETDGRRTLVFDELRGDNGPDLHVYLSPAPVGPDADYVAGAVRIDDLKANVGTQTYELPDDLDVAAFASVVIWCDRFSVGFGAAPLDPA